MPRQPSLPTPPIPSHVPRARPSSHRRRSSPPGDAGALPDLDHDHAPSVVSHATSRATSVQTYSTSRIGRETARLYPKFGATFNEPHMAESFGIVTKSLEDKQKQMPSSSRGGQTSNHTNNGKNNDSSNSTADPTIPRHLDSPSPVVRPWPGESHELSHNQLVDNLYHWQCRAAGYGAMRRKAQAEDDFGRPLQDMQEYAEKMVFHLARMRLARIKQMETEEEGDWERGED